MANGTVFRIVLAQRGKHDMLVAREDQITVDLICDYKHMMPAADLAHSAELLLRINTAHRIVRVA